MGRLVNTADINNVLMSEKSNYGVFAVEIDNIISGIVSKCPTIEQESCYDCISRQAALEKAINIPIAKVVTEDEVIYRKVIFADDIEKLPSITPQPKTEWIPVSKMLPKENKTVIASTKYGVYPEAKYTKEYGWEWAYEAGADYWEELEYVEAWMPLPEPYEPQDRRIRDE